MLLQTFKIKLKCRFIHISVERTTNLSSVKVFLKSLNVKFEANFVTFLPP
jgi:hypothetical protein